MMRLCLTAIVVLVMTDGSRAALIGMELITNGGAETGDTSGWTSTGVEVVPAVGFQAGFGEFAFTGGLGDPSQTLRQIVDVSLLAATIDAGTITSTFGVQLQGRADFSASDSAEATLFFRDAGSAEIASVFFFDADAGVPNDIDWDFFEDIRTVPTGTRSIDVLLRTTRTGGVSSDGFFDEVSLTLTAIPEPTSLVLLGLTAAGFCAVRWRRPKKSHAA